MSMTIHEAYAACKAHWLEDVVKVCHSICLGEEICVLIHFDPMFSDERWSGEAWEEVLADAGVKAEETQ